MSNSFLNKVSAERRFLSVINARSKNNQQLTGLSSAAIDLWNRQADEKATKEILELLNILAEQCQCLSDRSHEAFRTLDDSITEKIESNIYILTNKLSHFT